jgi:hypothetical protein
MKKFVGIFLILGSAVTPLWGDLSEVKGHPYQVRATSVGVPDSADGKVTLELMMHVADELLKEQVVEKDVDPKAFDFDPDAEDKNKDDAGSAHDVKGIKFLSEAIKRYTEDEEEVAEREKDEG